MEPYQQIPFHDARRCHCQIFQLKYNFIGEILTLARTILKILNLIIFIVFDIIDGIYLFQEAHCPMRAQPFYLFFGNAGYAIGCHLTCYLCITLYRYDPYEPMP